LRAKEPLGLRPERLRPSQCPLGEASPSAAVLALAEPKALTVADAPLQHEPIPNAIERLQWRGRFGPSLEASLFAAGAPPALRGTIGLPRSAALEPLVCDGLGAPAIALAAPVLDVVLAAGRR